MLERVSFSNKNLELTDVSTHHIDLENSLRLYFSSYNSNYSLRFNGYQQQEVDDEFLSRIEELDKTSALSTLSSLEAAFRIDYLVRCYNKKEDKISRRFRDIHSDKGNRIRLEDELLKIWKEEMPARKTLFSELIGALKYRHWLAHGRYWVPKLGKKYDYYSVYVLATRIYSEIPLESN